jgi:hypothetical protein
MNVGFRYFLQAASSDKQRSCWLPVTTYSDVGIWFTPLRNPLHRKPAGYLPVTKVARLSAAIGMVPIHSVAHSST